MLLARYSTGDDNQWAYRRMRKILAERKGSCAQIGLRCAPKWCRSPGTLTHDDCSNRFYLFRQLGAMADEYVVPLRVSVRKSIPPVGNTDTNTPAVAIQLDGHCGIQVENINHADLSLRHARLRRCPPCAPQLQNHNVNFPIRVLLMSPLDFRNPAAHLRDRKSESIPSSLVGVALVKSGESTRQSFPHA